MSCNCTKCSPNKCSCKDSALTNPCSYTECPSTAERCDESVSPACVTWTGPETLVEDAQGDTFVIQPGERLEQILQRMMLVLADGLVAGNASNSFHAPLNLYIGTITSSSIELLWSGEATGTTSLQVQYDTAVGSSWTTAATLTAGVFKATISSLVAETKYKFRIIADNGATQPESVIVFATTLTA